MARPKGMIDEPTMDANPRNRPSAQYPEGKSRLRSGSYRMDSGEVLLPHVREDGWQMSPKQAVEHYKKTGRHLGVFATPEDATAYAKKLSKHMK